MRGMRHQDAGMLAVLLTTAGSDVARERLIQAALNQNLCSEAEARAAVRMGRGRRQRRGQGSSRKRGPVTRKRARSGR